MHSSIPGSGGIRSSMPVDGHENATSFGLCAAFAPEWGAVSGESLTDRIGDGIDNIGK